jgi:hypothetical protein
MILLSENDVDNMAEHPVVEPEARRQFRAVLAHVAAQARQVLPQAVNGRIESAMALCLSGDVALLPGGSATVGAASDVDTVYTVTSSTGCVCPDAAHRLELKGWCKHVRFVHPKLAA